VNFKSPNAMKTLDFKHHGHLPIPFKNTPRSKALEPVCLSRSHLPPFVTQSLEGEGRGGEQLRGKFTQKIEVCQQKHFPKEFLVELTRVEDYGKSEISFRMPP